MIEFKRIVRFAELLNPSKGFELERQVVEHRFDPLTGDATIVTSGRFDYARRLFQADREELRKIVELTRPGCPFCPENVAKVTPKFPEGFLEDGRPRIGEATAFPGLFAHMDFNAIIVLSEAHFLELNELAPRRILDAFILGSRILGRLLEVHPEIRFGAFIGNYLPPSGSSIIHPHIHVLASERPFELSRKLMDASRRFNEECGENFWERLLEVERSKGERYLWEIKGTEWIVPFAPSKTFEVWGLSKDKSSILSLGKGGLEGFAEGLGRILGFYASEGLSCFNFALYSGPMDGEPLDYFRVGLRIVARFGYRQPFTNDVWGLQALLQEGEAYEAPEVLAERLRSFVEAKDRT
jgi:UDPglucose--hexose-1-phosphate uridylyltransferase